MFPLWIYNECIIQDQTTIEYAKGWFVPRYFEYDRPMDLIFSATT